MEPALPPRKHWRIFTSVAQSPSIKALQLWDSELEYHPTAPSAHKPIPRELRVQKESLQRVGEISAPEDASSSLSL